MASQVAHGEAGHGPRYALFRKSVWSVVKHMKAQGNVWDKYDLETNRAERVVRHRYDASSRTWREDVTLFKVASQAFDEGAMRRCFRAKKLPFGHVIRFHPLNWKKASNYIVKEYKHAIEGGGVDRRAFDDVKWQSEAALWAADYNRSKPPKPIKMIGCCVVEFPDRPGRPLFCAERFIDGTDAFGDTFVKHNTNSGWTESNQRRLTPEAFSAHSFYASRGEVLVCDIQGVGDLFTDPQLHSADESHGDGDLGRRGMALFFASSDGTNDLMKLLKIPPFALTASERRRAAKASAPPKSKRGANRRSSAIRYVPPQPAPEAPTLEARDRAKEGLARGRKMVLRRHFTASGLDAVGPERGSIVRERPEGRSLVQAGAASSGERSGAPARRERRVRGRGSASSRPGLAAEKKARRRGKRTSIFVPPQPSTPPQSPSVAPLPSPLSPGGRDSELATVHDRAGKG